MEKLLDENLLVNARVCTDKKVKTPLDCFTALGHEIAPPQGNEKAMWEARMKRRSKRLNGEEVEEEDKKEVLSDDYEGGEEEEEEVGTSDTAKEIIDECTTTQTRQQSTAII